MYSFFDADLSFGKVMTPGSNNLDTAATLLEKMDSTNTTDALVYHSLSKEYCPLEGNRVLLDEIKGQKRLHPCLVVLPNHTGEFMSANKLIDFMNENSAKVVRMFPAVAVHNFPFTDWAAGDLFQALQDSAFSLIIDATQVTFSDLYVVAKKYSKLQILLSDANYRTGRSVIPLMKQCTNISLISWAFKVNNGFDFLVKTFGAQRLIYGSNTPIYEMSAAQAPVIYADISESDKQLISSGNIKRILGI